MSICKTLGSFFLHNKRLFFCDLINFLVDEFYFIFIDFIEENTQLVKYKLTHEFI